MSMVEEALRELKHGKPVLIYDWPNRESEVDMVFYAGAITPEKIYKLRAEAGGLICYGTSYQMIKLLKLPLFDELLESRNLAFLMKNPSYGARSNLVIWVNSVKVHTGISDVDRSVTISTLHRIMELVSQGSIDEAIRILREELYAPGHIPVLAAKDLSERRGHTELAVWLAAKAGLMPSVVYAEMLGFNRSMTLEEAMRYAEKEGLILVKGDEILEYLRRSEE